MTYAGRSLWVSDEAADLIWEYVHALREADQSEIVTVPALDDQTRTPISVTLVLSSATPLVMEGPDADNGHLGALGEIRERIEALRSPSPRQLSEAWPLECEDDGELG